jgi:catechol 2,3-dioxygenase-like lactoylglutathione lyase family enzyme
MTMFKNAAVLATIPAEDIDRAKTFYVDTLGFTVRMTAPDGGLLLGAGDGSSFLLYPTQFAGTAEHTVAAIAVDKIEPEVEELRSKGVVFEDYDMPGLKTENGIATMGDLKAAWFKDTEGNIIGVSQMSNVLA